MSARPFAELLEDGRLAIHATKVLYILTPGEVVALLPCCRSLWRVAIERGKAYRRGLDVARRATRCGTQAPLAPMGTSGKQGAQ